MHGTYKVPNGKLVGVDLEVDAGGKLSGVSISGDFFLEPAQALGRLNQALEGLPATTPPDALAKRVEGAVLPGDQLIGFGPRDIAIAVRRALGKATTWADHTFELIEDGPREPAMEMALDQVYAEALASGRRGPTLRFWQWASSAVVLGSFQSLSREVDLDAARLYGVTVVRRVSGGGAMFVEPGNTITYSLVVPGSLVDGLSFQESYRFLDAWTVRALRSLGVRAEYQPINDIASPQGKIAGAAQKRLADGTVLHHVTMAYDIDAEKMVQVLRIGQEKLAGKGTPSAQKRVDPVRRQTGLTRDEVVAAFIERFGSDYRLERSAPRPGELAKAEDLVKTKFGTREWTARLP
ncbi:MAG: lipoate--protein ligase family protein [Bifidobacteriaceae bacterium]|nr:lipoate--protein ligase family protein [Bifidobacteriaceae bacterium]